VLVSEDASDGGYELQCVTMVAFVTWIEKRVSPQYYVPAIEFVTNGH
jgi:hypothetical protein